jgi:hypothetical protein
MLLNQSLRLKEFRKCWTQAHTFRVARFIVSDFLGPSLCVFRRQFRSFTMRMSVPETAVNEYDFCANWKYLVSLANLFGEVDSDTH